MQRGQHTWSCGPSLQGALRRELPGHCPHGQRLTGLREAQKVGMECVGACVLARPEQKLASEPGLAGTLRNAPHSGTGSGACSATPRAPWGI